MTKESFFSFFLAAPSYVKARVFLLVTVTASVLVSALLSVGWIWKMHRQPTLTEKVLEHSRKIASPDAPAFTISYEIKDMSMALMNKKGTRTAYAQFTIIFDCPNEETKHTLELNRAKIINAVFEVGGDFYTEDFSAPLAAEGFNRFKTQIKDRLTEYFPSYAPRTVVLKEWMLN